MNNIYVIFSLFAHVCILIFQLMMQINLMSRRAVSVVGAAEIHDI